MMALHTHYAEGWLTKRGAVNTSWKLRWFVLRNRVLSYYKKKTVHASATAALAGAARHQRRGRTHRY